MNLRSKNVYSPKFRTRSNNVIMLIGKVELKETRFTYSQDDDAEE